MNVHTMLYTLVFCLFAAQICHGSSLLNTGRRYTPFLISAAALQWYKQKRNDRLNFAMISFKKKMQQNLDTYKRKAEQAYLPNTPKFPTLGMRLSNLYTKAASYLTSFTVLSRFFQDTDKKFSASTKVMPEYKTIKKPTVQVNESQLLQKIFEKENISLEVTIKDLSYEQQDKVLVYVVQCLTDIGNKFTFKELSEVVGACDKIVIKHSELNDFFQKYAIQEQVKIKDILQDWNSNYSGNKEKLPPKMQEYTTAFYNNLTKWEMLKLYNSQLALQENLFPIKSKTKL